MEWHRIHSFFHGWGLQEVIPDNQIVIEDHSDEFPPWKVVRSRVEEREIWWGDCKRLLGEDCFAPGFDPESAYERLKPLLMQEHEERLANYKPVKFEKITIPRINKMYPTPLF